MNNVTKTAANKEWYSEQLMFVLFDLMLYVHGKQLRSCWDGQLLNQTVPRQASQRLFTSIKCPFFARLID